MTLLLKKGGFVMYFYLPFVRSQLNNVEVQQILTQHNCHPCQ
jgi:hypothetical protein